MLDLQEKEACETATDGIDIVFNLAADMGGMGFIENNKALCMLSSLINTQLLLASENSKVRKFFYASSACVYAAEKQTSPKVVPLKTLEGSSTFSVVHCGERIRRLSSHAGRRLRLGETLQ